MKGRFARLLPQPGLVRRQTPPAPRSGRPFPLALPVRLYPLSWLAMMAAALETPRVMASYGLRSGWCGLSRAAIDAALRGDACLACGYNLTGNTSGTCPECGRNACRETGM